MKEVVKRRYQRAIEENLPATSLYAMVKNHERRKRVLDELNPEYTYCRACQDGKHRTSNYCRFSATDHRTEANIPVPSFFDTDTGRNFQFTGHFPSG